MKSIGLLLALTACLNLSAQQLGVMTYNIRFDNPDDLENRWENRKDYLLSQLRYHEPAVFGIQEGLHHQVQYLDQNLGHYRFIGVGRDSGGTEGEFSAVFYDTRRVSLIEQGTFWLSDTPGKPSIGWDAALPRICTYGRFRLGEQGREFLVFNTHFDHRGEQARTRSSELIVQKIKELNTRRLPVILMGDFNLEQSSEGIRHILEVMSDAHMEAGSRAHGPKGTFNSFEVEKLASRRIDYVFLSPDDWRVIRSAIISDCDDGRFPSDHFPVYAELLFLDE